MDRQRIGTFVIGGVLGALAGVILAPRSGRELRGSVADRVEGVRERGRETLFDTRERVQERLADRRAGGRGASGPPPRHEAGLGREQASDPDYPTDAEDLAYPVEAPPVSATGRPPLREVPREAPENPPAEPEDTDDRSEELRRKVQEIRARLGRQPGGEGDDG